MVPEGGKGEPRQQGGKKVNPGEKYPDPDLMTLEPEWAWEGPDGFLGSQEGEEEVAGLQ
jgi:hypothetical protein